MIASFSRALLEGLSDEQTDEQFNAQLDASIAQILRRLGGQGRDRG